jgi:hypothetical protein
LECVLAESNALGDGSANSIYLGDKIVSRSGRATGHLGSSNRHVVRLEFRNSRCDESRGGQIGYGPGRSVAESAEYSVRVVLMMKHEFAELDALSDGSTDVIYLEDHIVSRFGRAMGHNGWHGHHVEVLGFGNLRGDEGLGVRLDLTSAKTLPPAMGEPEAGFLGTVTSGKLPKVKEKPTVTTIWAVTLAEKTTPVLTAVELDV